MNRADTYKKTGQFLKLVLGVILLAGGFYFWERYLSSHFLGGFNAHGVAIPHSYTGFHFFFTAWPLWLFPLLIGAVLMAMWKQRRIRGLRDHVRLLEQHRIDHETRVRELQSSLSSRPVFTPHKQDARLHHDEQYRLLQADYKAIEEDYRQSKAFIEKLLEKLNSPKK